MNSKSAFEVPQPAKGTPHPLSGGNRLGKLQGMCLELGVVKAPTLCIHARRALEELNHGTIQLSRCRLTKPL